MKFSEQGTGERYSLSGAETAALREVLNLTGPGRGNAVSDRVFGIRMKELGMVQKQTSEVRFWQDVAIQA